MAELHLTIVTPNKKVLDEAVDELYLPTPSGEIGVLPYHANLMSRVIPGELRYKKDNQEVVMAVGSGLLQVANNQASLMIDLAENAADINESVVEEAKQRAEDALKEKLGDEEYAVALANLEKIMAQLKVKRRHQKI